MWASQLIWKILKINYAVLLIVNEKEWLPLVHMFPAIRLYFIRTVMVNFMCHLGHRWVMGCSDIWSSIILVVSVILFIDKINILINRVKQIVLPNVSGPHLISWRFEQNTLKNKEFFLPDCLWTWPLAFFSCLLLKWKHGLFLSRKSADLWAGTHTIESQALRLQLEINHGVPWVSSFLTDPADLGSCQSL